MAHIEGQNRIGGSPLTEPEITSIRQGTFVEDDHNRLATGDPKTCLEVLNEAGYPKEPCHVALAGAVLEILPDDSALNESASATVTVLSQQVEANEGADEATKAARKAKYEKIQNKLSEFETRTKTAKQGDESLAAIGSVADTAVAPGELELRESDVEKKKLETQLAHCRVDLRQLTTEWKASFTQREPDLKHAQTILADMIANHVLRTFRHQCLVISCSAPEFERHVDYSWQLMQEAGECLPATLGEGASEQDVDAAKVKARAAFKKRLVSPGKDSENGMAVEYQQLQMLFFHPDTPQPMLEAGLHRRLALSLFAEQKLSKADQTTLSTFKPSFSDKTGLNLLLQYSTWGVLLMDSTRIHNDIPLLQMIRLNAKLSYKDASEGDWVKNFLALWESFSATKKAEDFTTNEDFTNNMCIRLLGMGATAKAAHQNLLHLCHCPGLHEILGIWVNILANRTNFRLHAFKKLSSTRLHKFASGLLRTKVAHLRRVFSGRLAEYVTAQDIILINRTWVWTKLNSGASAPFYANQALLDLFYPDRPDALTGTNPDPLPLLTDPMISAFKQIERYRLPLASGFRGNRNCRRPNFLSALPHRSYDQAFETLNQNTGNILVDPSWTTFVCSQQMPLLSRAVLVLIWFFDPNYLFPYGTSNAYRSFDLQDVLFKVVGWKFEPQQLTQEELFTDGAFDKAEEKGREREKVLDKFMLEAFNEIRTVLSRKGSGKPDSMKIEASKWLTDPQFKGAFIPGTWIGHITIADSKAIVKTIRNSPHIMAVLKLAKGLFPFEERAVGLGAAIAATWRAGSGVDFFGDTPRSQGWEYLHQAAIPFYKSLPRVPTAHLQGEPQQRFVERITYGWELIGISEELLTCARRLAKTNARKWVTNADGSGRREAVYHGSPNDICQNESEYQSLLAQVAHHILCIDEAVEITFPGIDIKALKGVIAHVVAGEELTPAVPADYTSIENAVTPATLDQFRQVLPMQQIKYKGGALRFADNKRVVPFPELENGFDIPPTSDSQAVTEYKKMRLKKKKDSEDDEVPEAEPDDQNRVGALGHLPSPRDKKGKKRQAEDFLISPGNPLKKSNLGQFGMSPQKSGYVKPRDQKIKSNEHVDEDDDASDQGDTVPRDDENAPSEGSGEADGELDEEVDADPDASPLTLEIDDLDEEWENLPFPEVTSNQFVPCVRRLLQLDEADRSCMLKYRPSTSRGKKAGMTKDENRRRGVLIEALLDKLGYEELPKDVQKQLLFEPGRRRTSYKKVGGTDKSTARKSSRKQK